MPNRLPRNPFYYVRHGETDWNLQGRMQGQTNIPLNETGREQARQAAGLLVDLPIVAMVASPLDRAPETATIIQESLGVPMEIIPEIQEVYCGKNEGAEKGRWYTDWLEGELPEDGEAPADFLERILHGMEIALSRPGPVVVVSHGQVFRTLIKAIDATLDQHTPNGVPMYLEPAETGWSIRLLPP